MDEEDYCGLTEVFTLVSSLKTKCKVMVSSLGQTVENTSGNGRIALWMAKESTLGLTGENMRGSTLTIKGMDMECIRLPMVVSTLETGKMGCSTVLHTFIQSMERLKRANGLMAGVLAGLRSQNLNE